MVWYLPFGSFDALKTGMFSLEAWLLEKIFVLLEHQISAGQLSTVSSSTEARYCWNSVSPWMKTAVSRDQIKPIRVVNYL